MELVAERHFFVLVFFSVVLGFYCTFLGYAVIVHKKYSLMSHKTRIKRLQAVYKKESFKTFVAWPMLFIGFANYISLALFLGFNVSFLVVPAALFGGILTLLVTYILGSVLFWQQRP